MADTKKHSGKAAPEQVRYANMLFYGGWTGMAIMVITYLVYITGLLKPHVPVEIIPRLWSKSAHNYLLATGLPSGWGWTAYLGQGDILNFVGIVLLASMTAICYIPLIPAYLKRGEKAFGIMALLEVIVLVVAASGIVGGGH